MYIGSISISIGDLTHWRLVLSILGLGSMRNACYSKIQLSSNGLKMFIKQQAHKGLKSLSFTMLCVSSHTVIQCNVTVSPEFHDLAIWRIDHCSLNSQNVGTLEERIKQLSEQLDSQASLHQAAIRRAREAEGYFDNYKGKVRDLEAGLASSDALRDSLRTEREKVSWTI